jgi:FG-GAP repeat protein
MARFLRRRVPKAPLPLTPRGRRRPRLERLEDRCAPAGTVSITAFTIPQAVEGLPSNPSVNALFTDTNGLPANQLTATVNYGDGTALSTAMINQTGPTTYQVTDTHTFPEESGSTVPPFAFTATLHVFENGNPANTDTQTQQAQVLDAPLAAGDPVNAGTPARFFGGDTGDPNTAGQALTNFESAIGGGNNGANPPPTPLTTGFRDINWDGVKLDGTDFGGPPNTTVITPNHTVGIPLNRFQERGVFFGAVYAVSNDGFTDVNPNVAGLFPAFSPNNVFAMFNDNGIDFKFVVPSSHTTTVVSAAARGFGAIFLNVQQPGTKIQYFSGGTLIDTLNVPTNATPGAAIFAGELFNNPLVTNVLLTLGQGVIFRFDGTTATSGGMNTPSNNLVAVDDFVYPEPVAIANGFPIVSGGAGTTNAVVTVKASQNVPFTGVAATFSDADPMGNARDYTATINWGDGHLSNGTVAADGHGGFTVSGTNTYAQAGLFSINVDIFDFGGGPGPGGSMPMLTLNNTARVAPRFFAVGGGPGIVELNRPDGSGVIEFRPFGTGYTGGVSVAIGDVNGDGFPDIVVGEASGSPQVKVYNGLALVNNTFDVNNPDADLLASFFPFGSSFNVGVNVAVGDVTGDGFADIVTGANAGNPDVRVFNGKDIATGTFNPGTSLLAQWFPYALQFNVGVNVAVGDVSKNGFDDVVTGASVGNPDVRVFNGKDIATHSFNPFGSSLLAQWFAFGLNFNIGAFVAVGDTHGAGFGDVIVGAASGNPQVKVYNGQAIAQGTFSSANPDASLLTQFFAFSLGGNTGVTVGASDIDNDGLAEILTGATTTDRYRVVLGNATGILPPPVNNIDAMPPNFDPTQGVFVGG